MIWTYLGSYLAEAAIFTLFLMSGYLFFYGEDKSGGLAQKLLRRVRRLLVPFLLWSFIFCALYVFAGHISPRAAERLANADAVSTKGFLLAVFNFSRPLVYGPLWFLRALLYLAVAGAITKLLVLRMRTRLQRLLMLVLCVLIILIGVPKGMLTAIVPPAGIALYFLGGAFAELGYAPEKIFCKGRWGWSALLVVATLSLFSALLLGVECPSWAEQLVWFVSAFAFWGWAKELSVFATHKWCAKWLLPTGFFVFVIHMFVNRVIFHAAAAHASQTTGWLTGVSFLALVASIVVPLTVWHVVHCFCPKLVAFLEGK